MPNLNTQRVIRKAKSLWHNLSGKAVIWMICILVLAGLFTYLPTRAANGGTTLYSPATKKLPIYSVDTQEKKVAISFDAAWGNEDTAKLLEILDEYKIKTTFFMTGGWVESYPNDVKAIQAAGHDLGNHSENHKNMSTLSAADCQSELMSVHEKVKNLTGVDMMLFRPPYGDYDDLVIQTARDCGYYAIQWDVDTLVMKV